jgi:diguanylate cyclase (GGDEF)-like protein/PAS domain S-box-containing protein
MAGVVEKWTRMHPELLERALESLAVGLTVHDATKPDLPIAFANSAFERLTGYKRDEVIGRGCDFLHGPETDPATVAEINEATARGNTCFVTLIQYRADGTPFWNEVALSPLFDADDRLIQYIALQRDASARVSGADALRAADERYRRLLENLNGVVTYAANFHSRTAEMIYVSPQIEGMLGYPHDAWFGTQAVWWDALHPDDRERVLAAQRRRFEENLCDTIEYRLFAADGSIVWVWDKVTHVTRGEDRQHREGMLVDVTAVKAAESALRLSEERQRSVVDALEDGVLVIAPDGTLTLANRGYVKIVGFEPEVGAHAIKVWERLQGFWEDGTPITAGNSIGMQVLESGEPVVGKTIRLVRPDGEERWVSANYLPLSRSGDDRPQELVMSLHDITERRRVSDALRASESRLRSVIESAPIVLWGIDKEGRQTLSEGRTSLVSALRAQGTEGASIFDRWGHDPTVVEAHRRALAGEEFSTTAEFGGIWLEAHYSPVRDSQGEVVGAFGVAIDVTERKQAEDRLSHLALHDGLTGLPNRTLFLDRLAHALARARRDRSRCLVLFVDLDRFKRINDSLGHRAGDQILLETADRIANALRSDDSVARLGGDEFTVLCEGIHDEREALRIAEKVTDELGHLYDVQDGELFISASIGVALSEPDSTPEQLLRDADAAMYRAKTHGRARIELFDEVSRTQTVDRLALESAMHGALEREEFKLVFQPKVSLMSGRVTGFEALLRWEHPDRGMMLPSEFISVAEDSGQIVPIGRWVIENAARQAAEWAVARDDGIPPLMCINLSARQFAQPDIVEVVDEALAVTGCDPGSLCLEITESVVMEQTHATIAVLDRLKDLGVRLAIDDFGTGYSSLGYLQRFRIDFLKIDRSFVERLATDSEQYAIVDAIVRLAQALGLGVIAEGVETPAQVQALRELGCELVQGFLFARPQPAEEAAKLLDIDEFAFNWSIG